jgi:hypothetical protein
MGRGDPFPPELCRFRDLFNAGECWEAHEALEERWRTLRSPFYHGLILLASAWVHVERENPHGIDAQLRKALAALHGLPAAYLGVDLAFLRRVARAARRRVRLARDRGDTPDWSALVPRPPLVLDPGRVRGDEREG